MKIKNKKPSPPLQHLRVLEWIIVAKDDLTAQMIILLLGKSAPPSAHNTDCLNN